MHYVFQVYNNYGAQYCEGWYIGGLFDCKNPCFEMILWELTCNLRTNAQKESPNLQGPPIFRFYVSFRGCSRISEPTRVLTILYESNLFLLVGYIQSCTFQCFAFLEGNPFLAVSNEKLRYFVGNLVGSDLPKFPLPGLEHPSHSWSDRTLP